MVYRRTVAHYPDNWALNEGIEKVTIEEFREMGGKKNLNEDEIIVSHT